MAGSTCLTGHGAIIFLEYHATKSPLVWQFVKDPVYPTVIAPLQRFSCFESLRLFFPKAEKLESVNSI
jgi:hypothetical protein